MARSAPDALLLIAPGCAHCPSVLQELSALVKEGKLGRLEVVNIVEHPEVAQQVGTRSVPWTRIGPFELEGNQSQGELERWTGHAANDTGVADYFSHLLETQRPHRVTEMVHAEPQQLDSLLALLESEELPMAARIGIGVVMEELQGEPILLHALPTLLRLSESQHANLRADAAHYLGLCGTNAARPRLQELLDDEHPDVREIAADSLQEID